jgi:hypothetical protein
MQLSQAEVRSIDAVVRSVRDTAHRKTLAAKYRDAAQAEKLANQQRKAELHRKRFLGIIERAEKGWLSLLTALRTPKLSELFAHTHYFNLYSVGDEATEVTVAIVRSKIELSITGSRVSSCQEVGGRTSYTDCSTVRQYSIVEDSVPSAFFRSVFTENFRREWFDWLEDVTDEAYDAKMNPGVGAEALKQFFSFDSTSIISKTNGEMEELKRVDEEGFDVSPAWIEMNIQSGWVLIRFFYDCADPEVLGKHLSAALQNLRV